MDLDGKLLEGFESESDMAGHIKCSLAMLYWKTKQEVRKALLSFWWEVMEAENRVIETERLKVVDWAYIMAGESAAFAEELGSKNEREKGIKDN